MSETGSDPQVNSDPSGEPEDELARAAAAGPPLKWDDSYGDAGDDRPAAAEPPDLMYQIFREPPELQQEERGE